MPQEMAGGRGWLLLAENGSGRLHGMKWLEGVGSIWAFRHGQEGTKGIQARELQREGFRGRRPQGLYLGEDLSSKQESFGEGKRELLRIMLGQ